MIKKKTYRFASGGGDVPTPPAPPEEESVILHYLDDLKPPKERADYLEIVNNRIYFYSGVETKNVLGLNKALRDLGAEIQHSSTVLECPPADIFLHVKVGDFGLSKCLANSTHTQRVLVKKKN